MAAMLHDIIVFVVVGRTRPRSIMPLAMLHGVSISLSMHACDLVPIVMVLRLAALGPAIAPLKLFKIFRNNRKIKRSNIQTGKKTGKKY